MSLFELKKWRKKRKNQGSGLFKSVEIVGFRRFGSPSCVHFERFAGRFFELGPVRRFAPFDGTLDLRQAAIPGFERVERTEFFIGNRLFVGRDTLSNPPVVMTRFVTVIIAVGVFVDLERLVRLGEFVALLTVIFIVPIVLVKSEPGGQDSGLFCFFLTVRLE